MFGDAIPLRHDVMNRIDDIGNLPPVVAVLALGGGLNAGAPGWRADSHHVVVTLVDDVCSVPEKLSHQCNRSPKSPVLGGRSNEAWAFPPSMARLPGRGRSAS